MSLPRPHLACQPSLNPAFLSILTAPYYRDVRLARFITASALLLLSFATACDRGGIPENADRKAPDFTVSDGENTISLANYRGNPSGERAADSLYYLGQAVMKLGQPGQACKAYQELDAVYGTKVRAELKKQEADAKAQAQCS